MKNQSYKTIKNFIRVNGYTYKVKDILENYQQYWMKGYYVSYTMEHCIKNLENEIKDLLNTKRLKMIDDFFDNLTTEKFEQLLERNGVNEIEPSDMSL